MIEHLKIITVSNICNVKIYALFILKTFPLQETLQIIKKEHGRKNISIAVQIRTSYFLRIKVLKHKERYLELENKY